MICDGIHVGYTHHWLIKDFYEMIERLTDFISSCIRRGYYMNTAIEELGGNYSGTEIRVIIEE